MLLILHLLPSRIAPKSFMAPGIDSFHHSYYASECREWFYDCFLSGRMTRLSHERLSSWICRSSQCSSSLICRSDSKSSHIGSDRPENHMGKSQHWLRICTSKGLFGFRLNYSYPSSDEMFSPHLSVPWTNIAAPWKWLLAFYTSKHFWYATIYHTFYSNDENMDRSNKKNCLHFYFCTLRAGYQCPGYTLWTIVSDPYSIKSHVSQRFIIVLEVTHR